MVFRVGEKVWVKGTAEWVWEVGTVEEVVSETEVVVLAQSNRRILTDVVFKANSRKKNGFDDMTSMTFVNEPSILSNLHSRSYANFPYTFLGSVLVAVNPLQQVQDQVTCGSPDAALYPHPYAVAELSLSQLEFGLKEQKRDPSKMESPISQTVVVGGESGAGKTESSRRVLEHLVARCGGGELDKRLLGTNPILEAFGNAQTLRNSNSSRFGKMMRLHFDRNGKEIVGASIETYLLERSRVTSHELGERAYHIFYYILAGLAKEKQYAVNAKTSFRYLTPVGEKEGTFKPDTRPDDILYFQAVISAFKDLGIPMSTIDGIMRVVAAVLHLGNITFVEKDAPQGRVAVPSTKDASKVSISVACDLLGFKDQTEFCKMFTERVIKAPGSGEITTFNDGKAATEAKDAVAKALYSRLFTYIVNTINRAIDVNECLAAEDPKIGVLDIFGFESFAINGFEQLLINYTNEALQSTFNDQIFSFELQLYKSENLLAADDLKRMTPPKTNDSCMELLEGKNGILAIIDQQGKLPNPNDKKMNDALHKAFRKSDAFGRVHPKDIDRQFIVIHYAGSVSYSVGSFLLRNADTMPKSVDHTFDKSTDKIVQAVWDSGTGSTKQTSIVSGFKSQIVELKSYLDSTRCTFIRCIKPNARMKREDDWFDRRYVTAQLKALSILSTAEVLKNGFPTRVTYSELVESFMEMLPDAAISTWKSLGGGSESAFVKGILSAFKIETGMYKLGRTRVFFRSGSLAEVTNILDAASKWKSGGDDKVMGLTQQDVIERFTDSFQREVRKKEQIRIIRVRLAVIRAFMINKKHNELARARQMALENAAIVFQKVYRGKVARKECKVLMRERDARVRREAEEAERKLRQVEKERKEKEAKLEAARKAREQKEQERREAEERQQEVQRRHKELLDKEKDHFKTYKSNYSRLMAKRKKQMEELDAAGDFLDSEKDSSKDDETEDDAIKKLREKRAEEEEALREIEEQKEELDRELEEAKMKEEELNHEFEEANQTAELTKKENQALFAQWKRVKAKLEKKRQKQMEELDNATESMHNKLYSMEGYFDYLKSGNLVTTHSRDQTMKILKARGDRRRPSKKSHATAPTDDDYDSDDGYNFGATRRNSNEDRYLEATGEKLPVKQGTFRIFNRWQARRFQLDVKALTIRYFHFTENGKNAGKSAGVFHLNDVLSITPSKVTLDPIKYQRRGKKVLMIENGFLGEEATIKRGSQHCRTLVIAFRLPREAQRWYEALHQFTPEARPTSTGQKSISETKSSEPEEYDEEDTLDVTEEELAKWQKRQEAVAKTSLSDEEKQRLLLNPVLADEEETADESMTYKFCKGCRVSQNVPTNQPRCPTCGEFYP